MKTCKECKNPGEFYVSNGRERVICKECSKLKMKRRWREKAPEISAKRRGEYDSVKIRNQRIKRAYGVMPAQFQAMLDQQGGTCANPACRNTEPGGRGTWKIDHDHKTGQVRGLLCNSCNLALGHVRDEIDRLQGLIDYLKKSVDSSSGALYKPGHEQHQPDRFPEVVRPAGSDLR